MEYKPYNKKFHEFEINQPLYMSYSDGSFCIFQKINKSEAKVVCMDAKDNEAFKNFRVGMILTGIPSNSLFGAILK